MGRMGCKIMSRPALLFFVLLFYCGSFDLVLAGNIIVHTGGSLIVSNRVVMNNGDVRLKDGSQATLAGGSFTNVHDFILEQGSSLTGTSGAISVNNLWHNDSTFTLDTNGSITLNIMIHSASNHATGVGDTDGDGHTDVGEGCWDFEPNSIPDFLDPTVAHAMDRPPDNWLVDYGLSTNGSADFVDTDGDGANNWQEYHAGTDPTNENSVFEFNHVTAGDPGSSVFEWNTVSGKQYVVMASTNLVEDSDYSLLVKQVTSDGATIVSTSTVLNSSAGAHRVEVIP